jgi:hypothetical protein
MNRDSSTNSLIKLGAIMAGILLLTFFFLYLADGAVNSRRKACQEKGGTYFWHEQKCLAIPEIKIP